MTRAFIVGHPIQHSRSPLIHGHWLHRYGIAGSYERIDIAPVDFLSFLKSFGQKGFVGGNVTIPHKEAAFAGVDRRTGRAERVGAVNTIWVENGVVWGDNTDAAGFVDNCDQTLGKTWSSTVDKALVIGAGGAARAIVSGLQDRSIGAITVVNRTGSKAQEVSRDLSGSGGSPVVAAAWTDLARLVSTSDLIVNTTSLGMTGQPALEIDLTNADAVVADIVYVPLKTPLLREAENRGLRIIGGLGMLLHQAAPGFERWFGVKPEVTPELEALMIRDIEAAR